MKRAHMEIDIEKNITGKYLVAAKTADYFSFKGYDTFKEALDELRQRYIDTMVYSTCDFPKDGKGKLLPFDEDLKEEWNQMIDHCVFCIIEWDDNKNDWNKKVWILEHDEEASLGWMKK